MLMLADVVIPGNLNQAVVVLSLVALVYAPIDAIRGYRVLRTLEILSARKASSWIFRLMKTIVAIITVVSLYLCGLGLAYFAGVKPLPEWSIAGLSVALVVLAYIPRLIVGEIRRRRRPPP